MAGLLVLSPELFSIPAQAAPAASESALAALAGLDWMAGCWQGREYGMTMEECWTSPGGGMLLGMHRDIAPSGKGFFEFLRIAASGDSVAYWGSPMGKPPVPFRLKEQGPKRVLFENPAHDFPQRIVYWLEGETLHARVEGIEEGVSRQEEWQWGRAGVTPPAADHPAH